MEKENREHKDSVFVDLFYQDETAKKNLLSLYNALHDTEYQDEDVVRKVKIEDVLYKNFKNDISFEINGQVLVLGEHQSTVNCNMPLRCLLYVGRAYEQLIDKEGPLPDYAGENPDTRILYFLQREKRPAAGTGINAVRRIYEPFMGKYG